MTKIDVTALDPNLVVDIAGHADGYEAFKAEHKGTAIVSYHIAFNANHARGGIVLVGSGSSGATFWTDAHSPDDVLARYLADDMLN